jgi:hypothetical protein
VDLEITPEPSPEERDALERALARLLEYEGVGERGAWWREGVGENVNPEEEPA